MATALIQQQIVALRRIIAANSNLEGLVLGAGSLAPKFVLIAEAPGKKEIELGRGFVGPSGQELQQWLDYLRVTRTEIYMTAVVRARPIRIKNDSKRDRPPTKTEIKEFAPFLDSELAQLNTDVIVVLGNTALHRLLGQDYKISQVHGQLIRHTIREYRSATGQFEFGTKVWTIMPLFHPSYIRRFAKQNRPLAQADLVKLKTFLTDK
ncbi:uracil-DNA glycosylase [Lapidilactobacillus bayanensis]|uniref:uracil-DNA glycosylase n=1 Tax=Lapidilactobacillus bayanensis TaxID=2485998 RepID=UPI000F7A5DAC|nr:uracil-DNA glycosylase [Lapidilactobacillus bayanensis]